MAITPNAARRISQAVTTVERSIGSGSKLGLDPTTNHSSVIVKTPSGGIPARAGTTLGSASCTIQVVDKSNDSISAGSSIDVLNLSTTAVAGTTYINAIRDRAGNFVADLNNSVIPAATIQLSAANAGIFKYGITTTKEQIKLQLVDTPSLWIDYWEATASGCTASQMNIKLAGAYVVNIPFEVYLISRKTNQIELNVVGTNIYVYTDQIVKDVNIELWATDAGNTTYPGTSGDGVLLDRWHNSEADVGLSETSGTSIYRSGVLIAMFESEVDDFELQVWHYDANNTVAADAQFVNRPSGWIMRLPNSIDSTFDGTDLGSVSP